MARILFVGFTGGVATLVQFGEHVSVSLSGKARIQRVSLPYEIVC